MKPERSGAERTTTKPSPIRQGVYLSVDLEDLSHDMVIRVNRKAGAEIRADALWKSYERFEEMRRRYFDGIATTFFTTGVVAAAAPDLVRRIASDGHEIACHYNLHVSFRDDSPEIAARELDIAVSALAAASGKAIEGFRAPMFSLQHCDYAHWEVVAGRFKYDSSLLVDVGNAVSVDEARQTERRFGLKILPVASGRLLGGCIRVKAGGTYLRVMPTRWLSKILENTVNAGQPAIVYVHPYDFELDAPYWVSMKRLIAASTTSGIAWWIRQLQWSRFGNGTARRKLAALLTRFRHQGTLGHASSQ